MKWSIGDARQNLSALIKRAGDEPQEIYNREQPMAVMVNYAVYREFQDWQERRSPASLDRDFSEARELCRETSYVLELPERAGSERHNPFADDTP